jgi:hypothetical protein
MATQVPPTPEPPQESWLQRNRIPLFLAGAVLLIVIIGLLNALVKKNKEMVEKCAMCGAVLEKSGPCPICHSTERLKAKKE